MLGERALEFVRNLPCQCCNKQPPSDPHHMKTKGSGGTDTLENLVALCRPCHDQFHRMGRKTFFQKNGQRINFLRGLRKLPPVMVK